MCKEFVCNVMPDGSMKFIYDDNFADLLDEGRSSIRRASHVEPGPDGNWYADMSPVMPGRVLGPYRLRSEALAAEVEFLKQEVFA